MDFVGTGSHTLIAPFCVVALAVFGDNGIRHRLPLQCWLSLFRELGAMASGAERDAQLERHCFVSPV